MVKLLFFISTLSGGGAERVLVNLLNALSPEQYDITLVTLLGGINEHRLPEYVHYKKIIQTSNNFISRCYSYLWFRVIPPNLFHRLFLHGNYDIEIGYLTGIPSRIIQKSSNKESKKICFIHGDITADSMTELYGSLQNSRKMYEFVDKVCFVSEGNKNRYIEVIGDTNNLQVLHNIVDVDDILACAEQSPTLLNKDYDIKMISIGRLAEQKGYIRLLRIVNELNKKHSGFSLTILGNGEQKDELEKMKRDIDLKNVFFIPFQKNPYPYVANSNLFVCSSFWEGYSTAVSEAALLGTPVITTDCAGMNEIFSEGIAGKIVENSELALLSELDHYLSDADYRTKLKNEAILFRSKYERELRNNIKKYDQLFMEVLNKV